MEAAFWLYLVIGGLNDALPFAKGHGGIAAVLGTIVFVPFVLPALVLAVTERSLRTVTWVVTVELPSLSLSESSLLQRRTRHTV